MSKKEETRHYDKVAAELGALLHDARNETLAFRIDAFAVDSGFQPILRAHIRRTYGLESIADLTQDQIETVLDWIDRFKAVVSDQKAEN